MHDGSGEWDGVGDTLPFVCEWEGLINATPYNNHYYYYFPTSLTWHNAKLACESIGGHLVTIATENENIFVNNLAENNRIWIGFTDERVEGEWEWITGEPVIFENWASGEPNDDGGQDYGQMYSEGEWDDAGPPRDPEEINHYVCEWDYDFSLNSTIKPIYISSNSDFAEAAMTNNFSGSGVVDNPYIIENHTIVGSFFGPSIGIENTDVHFIIRNCSILGTSPLYFFNVKNGHVDNSKFNNSGITVENSSNCKITENRITHAPENSLEIISSRNCIIQDMPARRP